MTAFTVHKCKEPPCVTPEARVKQVQTSCQQHDTPPPSHTLITTPTTAPAPTFPLAQPADCAAKHPAASAVLLLQGGLNIATSTG